MKISFRLICVCLASFLLSFQTKAQQAFRSDTLDVVKYTIALDITNMQSKTIAGHAELNITPKINSISHINLDLLALNVDSVFVSGTKVDNFLYDDTLLHIPLPNTASTNDTLSVLVYYYGQPVIDPSTWGGFYFSNDGQWAYNLGVGFKSNPHNFGRVWFPCIDEFIDKAIYECHITVDSGKMAVCGGNLINTTHNPNGTTTWSWLLSEPIPTYLASVAVGEYVAITDTYNGMNGEIPIYIYVHPTDTTKAQGSFTNLKIMLATLEDLFGPYHWSRVGYVSVPFNSGAMEHATNIAYPRLAINGSLDYEMLVVHELGHSWFGNLLTCKTAPDMWINEGWASYCEDLHLEFNTSKQSAKDKIRNEHRNAIQLAHLLEGHLSLNAVPQEFTYGEHSYTKAETVVHSLRGYMGDELFFSTVTQMLQDYKYGVISSEEMADYMEQQSGLPIKDFFDAWIYTPGYIHLNVDSFKALQAGSNYEVTVYMRQKRRFKNVFAQNNRIEITFMDKDWNMHTELLTFSGQTGAATFYIPFEPVCAFADLEEKLCDATTDNYKVVKETGLYEFPETFFTLETTAVTDSAFVRVTHNWVRPEGFKTPRPGIYLSVNRYWKIEGIIPDNYHAKGRFRYSKLGGTAALSGLDDNLITNSPDSLILFYRASAADDWREISFTKLGTPSIGNLIADTILPGEYAFAIRHWNSPLDTVVNHDTLIYPASIPKTGQHIPEMKMYPNPTSNTITVELIPAENRTLTVHDINGKTIKSVQVPNNLTAITIDMKVYPNGTYIMRLYDKQRLLQSGRMLLTKDY